MSDSHYAAADRDEEERIRRKKNSPKEKRCMERTYSSEGYFEGRVNYFEAIELPKIFNWIQKAVPECLDSERFRIRVIVEEVE